MKWESLFPAASYASAASVCQPLDTPFTFQLKLAGEEVLVPKSVPSMYSSIRVTLTLSVAVTSILTLPLLGTVLPFAGAVMVT